MVMHTGAGVVLQTQSVAYKSGPLDPVLPIQFGFASLETRLPGVFADSFTVSVESSEGILYLVTADVNGVVWAPVVPGAWPVLESSIQRATTGFAVPLEGLTPVAAYEFSYPLPAGWRDLQLTINFDLFDNLNAERSLGYFRVIPEPSTAALLVLGIGLWSRCRFQRRHNAPLDADKLSCCAAAFGHLDRTAAQFRGVGGNCHCPSRSLETHPQQLSNQGHPSLTTARYSLLG